MVKRIKSAVLPSSTKTLVVGLMVAALLVVTAGFVAAQSSAEIINGCYDKKTFVLRFLQSGSSCTAKETPISWNKEGPRGPSDAYYVTRSENDSIPIASSDHIPIASLTSLPEGKYLMSVSTVLTNSSTSQAQAACFLAVRTADGGLTIESPFYDEMLEPRTLPENDVIEQMSFTVPLEVAADQSVDLRCAGGAGGDGPILASSISVTALRVENLTGQ
jgi:hypothetical protein